MHKWSRVRTLAAILVVSTHGVAAAAADPGAGVRANETPTSIVVGFVGGVASHDDFRQGPVWFARRLGRSAPKDVHIQIFENRHRKAAYQTILRLIDRNHDGALSPEEKAQARIIIFGHSWGAAAGVLLARELNRAGIPVLLTVQVDSVKKPWQDDKMIPENVAAAANFYQIHGIVHGRSEIAAADPARTQILGNHRFDYTKAPVRCDQLPPWHDRFFTPGHAQSECDPRLWSEIEALMLQRLETTTGSASAKAEP